MIFMVSDLEKSTKIEEKSNQKTDLEQSIDLEPFFFEFSPIWDPKLGPGASQKSIQNQLKIHIEIEAVWSASGEPLRTEKELI